MPDKLGRLALLLSILSVIAGSEASAQAVSEMTTAGSTSHRRTLVPAADRQDGPHNTSDVSQGFTKHLDRNVPAMLLITLVGALSTAAGAGGGALFVPLCNSLLEFNVKDSAAISQAIITGGAVAGALFALFQLHPSQPSQPLIDFDLALLLIPSLLLGTSIGVLLNHMFPVWLITSLLVCLLSYLTHKTLRKGMRLYQAECKAPADGQELHLVDLHQISIEAEHHYPVHNLLRSISEEPNAATVGNGNRHPSLAPVAELQQQEHCVVVNAYQKAPPKPTAVALTTVSSAAQSSGQQHLPNAVLGKAGQLRRSTSHDSTHSLKIRSEAAGPSMAEAALQADPCAALSNSQQGSSFSQLSDLSCGSSSRLGDMASLLPKSSPSQDSATGQSPGLPPASVLPKQAESEQQHASQTYQQALCCLPKGKILAASCMWVIFAGLQLAKGQLRACSSGFWAVYIVQAGLLLAASWFFVQQASTRQHQPISADAGLPSTCDDKSIWDPNVLIKASGIAVGGGALASTIGMGGGVIMGPLLLSLQVHPLVTAATSTLMILFSSSAATLSFAVAGHINREYALIYCMCNFVSSLAGVFLIGRVVRRTGKSAVIVLLLACTMAAGALASASFGGYESLQNLRTGTNLTFSSICT